MASAPSLERFLDARHRERERLAKILHDEIGQGLTAAGLALDVTAVDYAQQAPGLAERLAEVQAYLEQSFSAIRRLSRETHPDPAVRYGLEAALRMRARRFADDFGGRFEEHIEEVGAVPDQVSRAFYEVADCALDNIIRHAGASSASLSLEQEPDELRLEIRDDGRGFDRASVTPATGFAVMDYHVSRVLCVFSVRSQVGHGTIVELKTN